MSEYALGSSDAEARRLVRQAEYLRPHTKRTLERAGVGPGTRVLDLGAGMGDVSLIAAELGADVVAVERDPETIARATQRVAGHRITYVHGELPDPAVTGPFDVVCGRLILMYLPDPASVLRALTERVLAPTGAIAFVEYDLQAARSIPGPALPKRALDSMCRIFEAIGCHTALGFRLPEVFASAGFARPELEAMLWMASTDDCIGHEMVPAVLASMRPIAERLGLAGELDPDLATMSERLREVARTEGPFAGPLVVGAVARRA